VNFRESIEMGNFLDCSRNVQRLKFSIIKFDVKTLKQQVKISAKSQTESE